ncbi:MAG: creatininase family protein [Gemmataceae bacterium]|nr:creatininase family protein [Gemmataceae bacterium]
MELAELKWPDVAALSRDMPVLFPIAALEQHGLHMPVFTDSLLLGEVLRRIKEPLKGRVLFAPLFWLGNSHHHLDFPGTMSASPRVYLDTLIDMAENFMMHGFRRLVFLNGHGGNIVPSQQALFELRQKYRRRGDLLLLSATYWTGGGNPNQADPSFVQTQMGHACEWETSMMLRIRPELVGDYRSTPDVPWGKAFAPAHRAWVTKDRTEPGHIGFPRHASPEKGEMLFQVFSAAVVQLLERVVAWNGKEWDA